jgi:hypothetical protein
LTGTRRFRPANRFTNRFGIIGVVLAALAIRNDELGCHQSGIVAEPLEFSGPVMGARARFHPDQAGRQLCKKLEQFTAGQHLLEPGVAMLIDAMHLKHPLCNIKTDSYDCHLRSP